MIEPELAACFWYHHINLEKKKEIIARIIEPIIDQLKDYRFRYYIKDKDYTKLVSHLIKNFLYDRLIDVFVEYNILDEYLSNIEYEVIDYISQLTPEDIATISKINNEIVKQIQHYTYHNELIETSKFTIIMWSNASKSWGITHYKLKKGEEVKLDAGTVLVPFSKSNVSKYICLLNESPLYRYSFEAGAKRGFIGHLETILEWALKQMETEEYKKMQEKYT